MYIYIFLYEYRAKKLFITQYYLNTCCCNGCCNCCCNCGCCCCCNCCCSCC
ncbi:hypothetical protein ACFW04_001181 [Cataglyphis niger]